MLYLKDMDKMLGITLERLRQTIISYDEIEFSYDGRLYGFQKESVAGKDHLIVLSLWEVGDTPSCCFSEEDVAGNDREVEVVDRLLNERMLHDNTSIVESEDRIVVGFFLLNPSLHFAIL